MLDKKKLPPDLTANRVWVSSHDSDRRAIAYITERRRRRIAAVGAVAGLVAILAALAMHLALGLLVLGLAISVAGAAYGNGGRSGFYEVELDGSIGEYLGRSKPELSSMRGMRP
jgi:hypothetical protein